MMPDIRVYDGLLRMKNGKKPDEPNMIFIKRIQK